MVAVPPFEIARAFPRVRVPMVASWEKRFVELAVVGKRLVDVALPRVPTPRLKFVLNRFVEVAVVK